MADLYDDESARASLRFLVHSAASLAFPDRVLVGGRNVSGAYLYSFDDGSPMTEEAVGQLDQELKTLMRIDVPIETTSVGHAEAVAYFEKANMRRSVALLRSRITDRVPVHTVSTGTSVIWRLALLGQQLVPRTSTLAPSPPRLHSHHAQLLVAFGSGTNAAGDEPEAKRARSSEQQSPCEHSTSLLAAAEDLRAWGAAHSVDCVGALSALQHTASGRELHDFLLHAEFRQEALLSRLASAIHTRCESGEAERVGVVCIAGPTSSGKTTFATKLTMYLRNLGLTGVALTVDHYYLPLDRQPRYSVTSHVLTYLLTLTD